MLCSNFISLFQNQEKFKVRLHIINKLITVTIKIGCNRNSQFKYIAKIKKQRKKKWNMSIVWWGKQLGKTNGLKKNDEKNEQKAILYAGIIHFNICRSDPENTRKFCKNWENLHTNWLIVAQALIIHYNILKTKC